MLENVLQVENLRLKTGAGVLASRQESEPQILMLAFEAEIIASGLVFEPQG